MNIHAHRIQLDIQAQPQPGTWAMLSQHMSQSPCSTKQYCLLENTHSRGVETQQLHSDTKPKGIDPSAPITIRTTMDDVLHSLLIRMHKSAYLSFFSTILCEIRESPGLATSINIVLFSPLIIYVISGLLCARDEPVKMV